MLKDRQKIKFLYIGCVKSLLYTTISCLLGILLCGCPYSSAYRLDAEPQQPIDESLLGSWASFVSKPGATEKKEPVKIIISKKAESEYSIGITGYIDELRPFRVITDDTIKATAFASAVGDKTFWNITLKDRNYLAEIKTEQGKLSILPLCEHFTAKLVKSNEALRVAVNFHCKTRVQPLYDEEFCLRDMVRVK